MKSIYIHHHLGMGDHLICNGIVREYAKNYDIVFLFAFSKYINELKYLYRDLPNIKLLDICDEEYSAQFKIVNSHRLLNKDIEYLQIGYNYLSNTNLPADKAFYEQVKLDWEKRYTNFYVKRDEEAEQKVFNFYNPNNEPYVFIHHDSQRERLTMNKTYIKRQDLKLIEINFKPNDPKLFNFFHYMKLMENATESHYVDSSFKCLADSFILNKEEMYFHKIENIKNSTSIRNHWNVIEYF